MIICVCGSFCDHLSFYIYLYYSSNPPGFAFVLYKYGEDADTAVRSKFYYLNNKMIVSNPFFLSFLDMDGRDVYEFRDKVVYFVYV